MVPRPLITLRLSSSCCSFTASAVGLTIFGCCAAAGIAMATINMSASAPAISRKCAKTFAMYSLPQYNYSSAAKPAARFPTPPLQSGCDRLVISGFPAPGTGAVAALGDALLVALRDDVAIAREKRLGRAHLGAQRQLSLIHISEPTRQAEISYAVFC